MAIAAGLLGSLMAGRRIVLAGRPDFAACHFAAWPRYRLRW